MNLSLFIGVIMLLFVQGKCSAQSDDSVSHTLNELPGSYYAKVEQKLASLNNHLTKKSIKYLQKCKLHERKLRQRLGKINADRASVFTNAGKQYQQFITSLKADVSIESGSSGEYNAYLDTLSTSLSFLRQYNNAGNTASRPLQSLQALQSTLHQSEKIKVFIAQRKQQIKNLLSKHSKLPRGIAKEQSRLNKTAYYYSAQVNEYKELLKDASKAERKALSVLHKLPAFQKFMSRNSQLASLFRMPDNSPAGADQAGALAGLQTRASVQGLIQQRISPGGPGAQQIIQQSIAQARNELDQLKEKISKAFPQAGGGSLHGVSKPDFRPNIQKTRSFLKRLEYGANVQFAKSSNLFPASTNIGVSVGFRVKNENVIGIGASHKLGMGTIRRIRFSHEGIGLRSFADYKLKGAFFLSGGFELNYNAAFKKVEQLKALSNWQKSGLIGVSKKYPVSKKLKGEMRLLYDFFANAHFPVTQPLMVRVGYGIR